MGSMVARGNQAVASGQEVGGVQETKAIQGAIEGLHWLVPKDRLPQQKATLGMQPRDWQTHPVP